MGTGLEPLLRHVQGRLQGPRRRRRAHANRRTSRGHSEPPRTLQAQGAPYEVEIESHKDAGGHVEYLCRVMHKSGLHWRVWRRYSDLGKLHDGLAAILEESDSGMLPPFEEHVCWVPSFAQCLSTELCDHRMVIMQTFLDTVLEEPRLVQLEPVQQMLGVQAPEPPAGLRVVHRPWGHELEVRPACVEAVCGPEMTPGPVDGYKIEIKNVETGSCHSIVREVGWSGLQVQRARVGQLVGAQHEFTVSAFNLAGESVSVSVLVNVSMQAANPSNPPNGVAARELLSSTSRESFRARSPSAESPRSFLEDQQPHAGVAAPASFLEDERPLAGAAATAQTVAAPGASGAVLPPPVLVRINTGSPGVYRTSFPPLSRRSVSPLSHAIAHASPVVVHPANEVSARLTHRRVDLSGGSTSHADGLGQSNHILRTSTPRLQRNLQPVDAPESRIHSQRSGAQHHLQGDHVLGVRTQQTSFGPSNAQVRLPLDRSRIRQQHQPQPQQLHRQPRAQIQDASSSGVALGENPLFSPQVGLSGTVAPVMHRHEWVQPSQLRIEAPANPASPSGAQLQSHEWVQPCQFRIKSPANPAYRARLCEEGEDQLCVVCLTAEKSYAFVPCGHRCVCRSCGSELLREARPCPICRAQARSIMQIFV